MLRLSPGAMSILRILWPPQLNYQFMSKTQDGPVLWPRYGPRVEVLIPETSPSSASLMASALGLSLMVRCCADDTTSPASLVMFLSVSMDRDAPVAPLVAGKHTSPIWPRCLVTLDAMQMSPNRCQLRISRSLSKT